MVRFFRDGAGNVLLKAEVRSQRPEVVCRLVSPVKTSEVTEAPVCYVIHGQLIISSKSALSVTFVKIITQFTSLWGNMADLYLPLTVRVITGLNYAGIRT